MADSPVGTGTRIYDQTGLGIPNLWRRSDPLRSGIYQTTAALRAPKKGLISGTATSSWDPPTTKKGGPRSRPCLPRNEATPETEIVWRHTGPRPPKAAVTRARTGIPSAAGRGGWVPGMLRSDRPLDSLALAAVQRGQLDRANRRFSRPGARGSRTQTSAACARTLSNRATAC